MKRAIALALATCMLSANAMAITLYVDPARGNDSTGCGIHDPCKSLNGAQSYLASARPNENVVVQVAAGKFVQKTGVVWEYIRPPYSITIVGAGSSKTIFDGAGYSGTWLTISTPIGLPARLKVAKMTVTRYGTAITAQGQRDTPSAYISNVSVDRMTFDKIGGKYTTTKADTYGAVRFVNVRASSITGSSFNYIENAKRGELLHAVYLAHYSSGNTLSGNSMNVVSGDPIRVRDASSNNLVAANRLVRAGVAAHFSDWYCTGSECTKPSGECPSRGNVFKENKLGPGYNGNAIAMFKLFGSDSTCGTGRRLSTAGNSSI